MRKGNNGEEIRGWQWIFSVLWMSSSQKYAGAKIDIPDTVTFENGCPDYWLYTNSKGKLCQRELDVDITNLPVPEGKKRGRLDENEQIVQGQMAVILEAFLEFQGKQRLMGGGMLPLCTAWYSDGQTELLDAGKLRMLGKSARWRLQLDGLQAYVNYKQVDYGHYDAQITGGSVREIKTSKNVGLDLLTKLICKVAERGEGTPKISKMTGVFLMDGNNKTWFSYAEKVSTQLELSATEEPSRRQAELLATVYPSEFQPSSTFDSHADGSSGRSPEAVESAKIVGNELRSLLKMAEDKGVSISASFAHFDLQGIGYCDVHDLVDGLARLGIGISLEAAEVLMEMIGQASGLNFRASDLQKFINQDISSSAGLGSGTLQMGGSQTVGGFGGSGSWDSSPWSSTKKHRVVPPALSSTRDHTLDQDWSEMLPALRPSVSSQKHRASLGRLGSKSASSTAMGRPRSLPSLKDDLGSPSVQQSGAGPQLSREDTWKSASRVLPSPMHAWTIEEEPEDMTEEGTLEPKELSFDAQFLGKLKPEHTDLPRWARGNTRKALVELLASHTRWLKQQKERPKSEPSRKTGEFEKDGVSDDDERAPSEVDDTQTEGAATEDWSDTHSDMMSSSRLSSRLKLDFGSMKERDGATGALLMTPKDPIVHVEGGVVATYRILRSTKPRPKTPKDPHTTLGDIGIVKSSAQLFGLLQAEKGTPFDLLAVPDVFMTMDTLEKAFFPLIKHHPGSSMLIAGLPGLAGTRFTGYSALTNDLYARCIKSILQSANWLDPVANKPLFILGFGNGGNALLLFASTLLNRPDMELVRDSTRLCVLINSFLEVDKKMAVSVNNTRKILASSNFHQEAQLIAQIHFSDAFLSEHGRSEVLETFWSTRDSMDIGRQNKKRTELQSPHTPHSATSVDTSRLKGNRGLMAALKGILKHKNVSNNLEELRMPVLVFESSKDVFVRPELAEAIRKIWPMTTLTDSVHALMSSHRSQRLYIKKTEGGHEVLQEDKQTVLKLLNKCVKTVYNFYPYAELSKKKETDVAGRAAADVDDMLDILDESKLKGPGQGIDGQQEGWDSDIEGSSIASGSSNEKPQLTRQASSKTEDGELEDESISLDDKSIHVKDFTAAENKRQRRMHEQMLRKQRADEKKRLKMVKKRQEEADVWRERFKEEKEIELEAWSRGMMSVEDLWSRKLQQQDKANLKWEQDMEEPRQRALELNALRLEKKQRLAEEEAWRKRAMDYERRMKLRERARKRAEELELTLDSEVAEGGYPERGTPEKKAEVVGTVIQNFLQARGRLLEALKRQLKMEEKEEFFRKQCERLDQNVRDLRRKVRIEKAKQGGLLGKKGGAITRRKGPDVNTLQHKLGEKELMYSHVQGSWRERVELLESANRSVAKLKVKVKSKEGLLRRLLHVMKKEEHSLSLVIGQLRSRRDRAMEQKKVVTDELFDVERRYNVLLRELKNAKEMKRQGGKWIDTDVWQPGVIQRMRSSDLIKYLTKESTSKGKEMQRLQRREVELQELIVDTGSSMGVRINERHKMANFHTQLYQAFEKELEIDVPTRLKQMYEEDKASEKISGARQKSDMDLDEEEYLLEDEEVPTTLAQKIRLKPLHIHTDDERKWIGIDRILNSDAYSEQFQTDAVALGLENQYISLMSEKDLQRIMNLPEEVNVAFPFLRSNDELEAHRLINRFTFGRGQSALYEKDAISQNKEEIKLRKEEAEDAGTMELLMREQRLLDVRTKVPSEMTKDEMAWLKIDNMLHPDIFSPEELLRLKVVPPPPPPMDAERWAEKNIFGWVGKKMIGDKYVAKQIEYEMGLRPEPQWECTYNRHQLQKLFTRDVGEEDLSNDERYALTLLKKYYIPEDQLRVGKERLQKMKELEQQLTRIRLGTEASEESIHPASRKVSTVPDEGAKGEEKQVNFAVIHPAAFSSYLHGTITKIDPNKANTLLDSLDQFVDLGFSGAIARLVLIDDKQHAQIFEVKDQEFKGRMVRSHVFDLKNPKDRRVLGLKVTMEYIGIPGIRGYKNGRMAVFLLRLPTEEEKARLQMPIQVGYAPYDQIKLNTDKYTPGCITILHKPEAFPIEEGRFQIVVSAQNPSRYSIKVEVDYAETAQPFIQRKLEYAKIKQVREVELKEEIAELWSSIRLTEKKLRLVRRLMAESQEEKWRCEQSIAEANAEIEVMWNDMQDLPQAEEGEVDIKAFLDRQISNIHIEIAGLETELMYYSRLCALRAQARKEVRDQLHLMMEFRRERLQEQTALKAEMKFLRKTLPSAIAVIENARKAAQVAIELQTTLHSVRAADRWSTLAAVKDVITSTMTPAEEVRRRFRSEGYHSLTLEEKQWTVMDKVLNPTKYQWLKDEEKAAKASGAGVLGLGGRRGAIMDNSLNNAALKPFQLKKTEIERIIGTPWGILNRKEVQVRKLLSKYHDDPKLLQKTVKQMATGFDVNIAERVRAKMEDTRNAEEKEWTRIDKILNPMLWKDAPKQQPLYERKGKGVMRASKADVPEAREMRADAGKTLLDKLREVGGKPTITSLIKAAQMGDPNIEFSMTKKWECPFDRKEILEIWKKRRSQLKTADERKVNYLLKKYNGRYEEYIEWEQGQKKYKQVWTMVDHEKVGEILDTDIDTRARKILDEIDVVKANSNSYIDSVVLNAAKQRFPKEVLLTELEDDLDKLLIRQITRQERKMHYLLEETLRDDEDEDEEEKANANKAREQKAKVKNVQKELVAAQKAYLALKEKALMVEKSYELDYRLPGTCRACKSMPCQRKPMLDVPETMKRMEVLNEEYQFVRIHYDVEVFDSIVPRTVAQGGSTRFFRKDLIYELERELKELRLALRLNEIDEELHKAYTVKKDYMWLHALHGYDTVMWTDNAVKALEFERNKLIANQVAVEIADGILEWMLEGWHFGERTSNLETAGFVPSIKPSSPIQVRKVSLDKHEQQEARKKKDLESLKKKEDLVNRRKLVLPPDHPDSIWHPTDEKVVQPGNVHDVKLNQIQVNLKFGLYCIAAMYFRAIYLIRNPDKVRQELARGTARKVLVAPLQDAKKSDETGKRRYELKKQKEDANKRRKFYDNVTLAKREVDATLMLQRVIRGHIGRKAGLKYALKVLEYRSFVSLILACVKTIQRVFRGWKGRKRAANIRKNIAHYVIQLGEEEEDEDEELKALMRKI